MIEATSCGGVVIFRGKVLVLYKNYKNKYEGWVLPKGTVEEGEDFKANQTIRVIDQIGNDIATVFNTKYLGIMPNNEQGRISLWSDIVDIYMQLQEIQAIEGFVSTDLTVSEGNGKKDVVTNSQVKVTNAMEKMYMTVVVA